MKRLVSSRLLHFFCIGLVIFFLVDAYDHHQQRYVSCLTDSKLEVLAEDWATSTGRAVRPGELARLADVAMDEQVLVKEAMLQGLHKSDPVIIQRLLRDADFLRIEGDAKDKIEAVLSMDIAAGDEVVRRRLIQVLQHNVWESEKKRSPSDADLNAIYIERSDLGVVPLRISFEHIYFKTSLSESSSDDASVRAEHALEDGLENSGQGDAFLSGNVFTRLSIAAIRSIFGDDFSRTLSDKNLIIGKWFGPVKSSFGAHIVRITAREDEYRRSLLSLRSALETVWQSEIKVKRWDEYVRQLRSRYRVDCHANT